MPDVQHENADIRLGIAFVTTPNNCEAEAVEIAPDLPNANHEILRYLGIIQNEISLIADRMHSMESRIDELTVQKDWYSTSDLAEMMDVTRHTVQERWCNQARIDCEKDPDTGQWRIPAHEFERLKRGGKPLSNRSIPL